MAPGGSIRTFSGGFPVIRAHLSRRCPSFVEDQAVHVVGQVGQRDLGLGALDADGADAPCRECLCKAVFHLKPRTRNVRLPANRRSVLLGRWSRTKVRRFHIGTTATAPKAIRHMRHTFGEMSPPLRVWLMLGAPARSLTSA